MRLLVVRVLSLIVLASFALHGSIYAATPVDLDALGEKLAPDIDKSGVKSIAIVDFLIADERPSELGWYLANKLSDSIALKSPATAVVDRMKLQQLGLAPARAFPADTLKQIGAAVGADSVVSGKIEITPIKYLISVTVEKVADGSTIASLDYRLHASSKPAPAEVLDVGVPVCLYCPIPADTRKWNGHQPENVILSVIISAAGTAEKITVVRSPGFFFSEMAVEAVSGWKLRPAPGEDGKPTPVIVAMEVTFRSLRT